MKALTKILLSLLMISQSGAGQEFMVLKQWSFMSDSNVTVLFARNESDTEYLIIPVKSYYIALDNYLFKNEKMMALVEELNIEYIYDEFDVNEFTGDAYLVFDERNIFTSYGRDLKIGADLCPYFCITEILFNESLRKDPEFVIFDDYSISDIEGFAYNNSYKSGTWLDSALVVIEKGSRIRPNSKSKGMNRWLTYDLYLPYPDESYDSRYCSVTKRIKIRKLPRMVSYHTRPNENSYKINEYLTQWISENE